MSKLRVGRRFETRLLLVALLFLTGCKAEREPPVNSGASEVTVSNTPPFQTKEPERYQAIRTITITTPDGETLVRTNSVARDGNRRRHESETLSKRVVYLDLPEGKFVLLPDEKIFADAAAETAAPASEDDEITPERFLHDDASTTSYQNLGRESVSGRNANKYRTVVNSSSPGNVTESETLIWIDEDLNIPVRSETTSKDGTRVTIELLNVSLEVDMSLFQVPNDYDKIAFDELRKRLTATE